MSAANPRPYTAFAAAAAVGVLARNHPVELVWVWAARRFGGAVPPPNRAGRRFACAVAAVCFTPAAATLVTGRHLMFLSLGVVTVLVPAFVAVTNLCLPSLVLTAFAGAEAVAGGGLRSWWPVHAQSTGPALETEDAR